MIILLSLLLLGCRWFDVQFSKDPNKRSYEIRLRKKNGDKGLPFNKHSQFLTEWEDPSQALVPSTEEPFLKASSAYLANETQPFFDLPDDVLILDGDDAPKLPVFDFFANELYPKALEGNYLKDLFRKRLEKAPKFLRNEYGSNLGSALSGLFIPLHKELMYPDFDDDLLISQDLKDTIQTLNLIAPNQFTSTDVVSQTVKPQTIGGDWSARFQMSHIAPTESAYKQRPETISYLGQNPKVLRTLEKIIQEFQPNEAATLLALMGLSYYKEYKSEDDKKSLRKPFLQEVLSTTDIPFINKDLEAGANLLFYQIFEVFKFGGSKLFDAAFSTIFGLMRKNFIRDDGSNWAKIGQFANIFLPLITITWSTFTGRSEAATNIDKLAEIINAFQKNQNTFAQLHGLLGQSNLGKLFPPLQSLEQFFEKASKEPVMKELMQLLKTHKQGDPVKYFFFRDSAKILKLTRLIVEYLNLFSKNLVLLYQLDALASLTKLTLPNPNPKITNRWSTARIVPSIRLKSGRRMGRFFLKNLYHPFLPAEEAIANTIGLASHPTLNPQSKILLFAPNASGKSAFQEAIAYAHLLSMTVGVGPFHPDSFLSKPDIFIVNRGVPGGDIAQRSSFFMEEVKEISKARRLYSQLHTNPSLTALVLIDEIYRGTSAISAAMLTLALLRGEQTNLPVNFILATHNKPVLFALPDYKNIILPVTFPIEVQQQKLVKMPYKMKVVDLNEKMLFSAGGPDWNVPDNIAPLRIAPRSSGDSRQSDLALEYLETISDYYDKKTEKILK